MSYEKTEKHRRRISRALRGKPKSEAHKQAIREAHLRRSLLLKAIDAMRVEIQDKVAELKDEGK